MPMKVGAMAFTGDKRWSFTHPAAESRRSIRYAAAILCVIVAVLYITLMFLVADAEAVPGATDSNTYGAYLFLSVPYLIGAAVLVAFDRRIVWAVGAAVQVLVIVLFLLFGVGVFGPGVFEYEALSHLRVELWAAGLTGAQVVLFVLLGYLVATPTERGADSDSLTERGAERQ